VPTGNTGNDHLRDFSGDIIRLHEKLGWRSWPLLHLEGPVRGLHPDAGEEPAPPHRDGGLLALLLRRGGLPPVFRREGDNPIPIAHPTGLMKYAGARPIPPELLKFKGWSGKQTENKYSQWIWRQYASAFWDDIRGDNVLPFRTAKSRTTRSTSTRCSST
jgi:hypothetical protein